MPVTLTAKEFALELGTDARTARKFLRSHNRENGQETPGKGSRWSIEKRQVRSLKKAFLAWDEARKVAAAAAEAPEVAEEVTFEQVLVAAFGPIA